MNVDEDDTKEGSGVTNKPSISVTISKPKQPVEAPRVDLESYDFSLLDELFSLLDQHASASDDVEPILCGYFNKVVQALINKIKTKMLYYLLLKRKGDVFPLLLNFMQHHSLAQLLVELLQIKVATSTSGHLRSGGGASGGLMSNGGGRSFAFGGSDDDEEEEDDSENNQVASPDDIEMLKTLNERRQEVVAGLIEKLGAKNLRDFESCLNANGILMELIESEQLYGKIVEGANLSKLIVNACDMRNPNQAWALNVLASVIKEYPNYENQLSGSIQQDF